MILYRDGEPGDIAAEFFAAIGLEGMLPRLERDGVRRNVSPGRRKALLLACVPKDRRRAARHAPPGLTNLVVGTVLRSPAIADDHIRFSLPPAARQALVARYLAGNRALVARYGLERPGSFVELPAPDPAWRPPAPITGRELAALFFACLAACLAERPRRRAAALAARLPGFFLRILVRVRRARLPEAGAS